MLRSLKIQTRCFGVRHCLRRSKNIGHNYHRRMERHVRDGQHAGRLRRNHPLAAIVTLIRWIAGHGTAALHALLVLRHRGHTGRKLQAQQGDHGQNYEYSLAHHASPTLRGLDAWVNERIHRSFARPPTRANKLKDRIKHSGPTEGALNRDTLAVLWVQVWVQLKRKEWLPISRKRHQIGHLDFRSFRLLTEGLLVRILPGEPTPLSFNELRTFSGNSAL